VVHFEDLAIAVGDPLIDFVDKLGQRFFFKLRGEDETYFVFAHLWVLPPFSGNRLWL